MDEITGMFFVKFINNIEMYIDIDKFMVNHLGHPLYIVDVEAKIFNWNAVLSMKKVDK
jgi:hypothetical protein